MAVTPLIVTPGANALRRAFVVMGADAVAEMRVTIKEALGPMLKVARSQAYRRRRSGELGDAWRANIRGTSARLRNPLPQAAPLEFGGRIAPKGAPISLAPATHMIWGPGGAIEVGKDDVERDLLLAFERLAHRGGFAGV